MIGDGDFVVFFNTDDFALTLEKWSAQEQGIQFSGIISVVDDVALDGYAVAAEYKLDYEFSKVQLKEGDELTVLTKSLDGGYVAGMRYKVKRPGWRSNDGLQGVAYLSSIKSGASCN